MYTHRQTIANFGEVTVHSNSDYSGMSLITYQIEGEKREASIPTELLTTIGKSVAHQQLKQQITALLEVMTPTTDQTCEFSLTEPRTELGQILRQLNHILQLLAPKNINVHEAITDIIRQMERVQASDKAIVIEVLDTILNGAKWGNWPDRPIAERIKDPEPGWNVTLTYFKIESGKHYSSGEYRSNQTHIFEIIDEVKTLLRNGELPGLVRGHSLYNVLVQVPNHPHECPHMVYYESI